MKRTGLWVVAVGCLGFASSALAQPRVSVGEVKGKGSVMIRGAAVRALQGEGSVTLVSKDAVRGAAKKLGVSLPKGRREVSAALGIGAWVEGTFEREKKTLVTNLAVIDAASGKTLGVMSYDAPNMTALVKTVRSEIWTDLGELIKSGKAPSKTEPAAAEALAELETTDQEPAAAAAQPEAKQRQRDVLAEDQEPAPDQAEPAADEGSAEAEASAEETDSSAEEEPASEAAAGGATPLVLGVGLAGFTRDLVIKDDLSRIPNYDLGLGPSLVVNLHWYPAAHFSSGPASNIGIDLRGQLAFGLDSEIADNTSFPTSANGFGVGVRGRLPLGKNELAAVLGYAKRSFSIGKIEGMDMARVHPYVPSTSYSFMRVGVEAQIALGDKFALGAALAYLPTFSTGVESWFANTTANGIEGEVKLAYTISQSLDLNGAFGLQRFAMAFNPKIEDATAGKPIAGGAVDQYLSMTLGMSYRFAQ